MYKRECAGNINGLQASQAKPGKTDGVKSGIT